MERCGGSAAFCTGSQSGAAAVPSAGGGWIQDGWQEPTAPDLSEPSFSAGRSLAANRLFCSSGPKVYRVKVTPSGSSMRVNVRLNDHLVVPFLIDTGATDVVLPIGVAKQLGLDLESARTQRYRTANGVIESEVIVLESVDLGGARVENVPASVSTSMQTGLLGLSYFNHFRYRVDPVAGVVTLEDNGMVESGKIRGGRSEPQWRNAYHGLLARREGIEERLDDSGSKGSRYRQQLREAIDEVDRQIDVLDNEADDARVPMRWRD